MTLLRISLATLAVAATAAFVPSAHAQSFITGTQLAHACISRTPADENACNGYIAGSLDEVAANPALKAALCPPSGVKLSVLRATLGAFGKDHPEEAKGSGIVLVHAMMKANYPCPAK